MAGSGDLCSNGTALVAAPSSRRRGARLTGDQLIVFDAPMLGEIEQPFFVRLDQIEIAAVDDQLIAESGTAGHDFTGWGDDRRRADLPDSFLDAGLGYAQGLRSTDRPYSSGQFDFVKTHGL
jgi:hypothetical protein